MVLYDVFDELVCGFDDRGILPRRDEVCHLGDPVRHCEDTVVHASVPGEPGQSYDPIHPDCLPFLYRQLHALYESSGSVVIGFRVLAYVTRLYVVRDEFPHSRKIQLALDHADCSVYPQ